jgi:phosphocarrier protein HPr
MTTAPGPIDGKARVASTDEFTATSSALLTNAIGLHARPSVKLTKLAKTFASKIEMSTALDGPWVDAKSIVKIMSVKAGKGAMLHFRAQGLDAEAALAALADLVKQNFHGEGTEQGAREPGSAHG